MKYFLLMLAFIAAIYFLLLPTAASEPIHAEAASRCEPEIREVIVEVPTLPDPKLLTHAQEIWISALEWCESRGNPAAVNAVDVDFTSSYYSYQFKPGTFRNFGELYGVIPKGHTSDEIFELMKDTALQRQIVRDMIKDTTLNLRTQFPGCIRLLGMPPTY